MARRTRADLIAQVLARFDDNTTGNITPERARAMFIDLIDSLYSITDDNLDYHYRGDWNTNEVLPTGTGSGTSGANADHDIWIVPSGGWTINGEFKPEGTFIKALSDGAATLDQFKIY